MRPALTLVGYEEDLRPAMAYVFGSTFVCDTLKIAKQVYIACHQYLCYNSLCYSLGSNVVLDVSPQVTFDKDVMTRSVSLSGDVFDPAGTLTGGNPYPPLPLLFVISLPLPGARASSSSILLHLDQLWALELQLREKESELSAVSSQLTSLEKLAAKSVIQTRPSATHLAIKYSILLSAPLSSCLKCTWESFTCWPPIAEFFCY